MKRQHYLNEIKLEYQVNPICALLGPRQVGKTTLAHMYADNFAKDNVYFFDLEDPLDLARLENPMLTLSRLDQELIVIDEIQRRPDLFPILRVLVDRKERKQKFLILGSASRDLIHQSTETLAGRIGYIELNPFSLDETQSRDPLWLRGGFPPSYLAAGDLLSFRWRQGYVATFLERDLMNLGFQIPPELIRRFWMMLAHNHGQIFNATGIGNSLGVSHHTARRYLDILVGTFMLRLLPPWHENISKRQVKSPKVYFRDSGILHYLLGIKTEEDLMINPKLGQLWEGFALEEIIRQQQATNGECFFWATHSGAELDLLIIKQGKKVGYEFKYTDYPKISTSMRIACDDLKLDKLYLIFPGSDSFLLDERIIAQGL